MPEAFKVSSVGGCATGKHTQKGVGMPTGSHKVAIACVSKENPRTLSVCQ